MSVQTIKLLAKILPPSKGCDPKTYRDYVRAVIQEQWTLSDCQHMMQYFGCPIDGLVKRVIVEKSKER